MFNLSRASIIHNIPWYMWLTVLQCLAEDVHNKAPDHYRNPDLCRVPNVLPSVFLRALGKVLLCRVLKKNTRQNFFAECFFLLSAKNLFAECFFPTLGKDNFQIIFWSSKLIQMKKFSTKKLYNSSKYTIFILFISSYDKIKVNLFTKFINLSRSLWNYKRDV